MSGSGPHRATGDGSARMRRPLGIAYWGSIVVAIVGFASIAGCVAPPDPQWGSTVSRSELDAALAGLPEEAVASFLPLSEIFYDRISSRRFNSRATFDDPSLRQFFPTIEAFSDYYAGLVDALDRAYVRYNRPTRIALTSIERTEGGTLRVGLRLIGENDLPLRWWRAVLDRDDEWQWRDGRWWVVPGRI